jgi:hypothetical protein
LQEVQASKGEQEQKAKKRIIKRFSINDAILSIMMNKKSMPY